MNLTEAGQYALLALGAIAVGVGLYLLIRSIFASRFLDAKDASRLVVLLIGIPAHVICGVSAWYGSKFSLVILIVSACFWTFMAVVNSHSWRRTIDRWGITLESWRESNLLVGEYYQLLREASGMISTWDHEKADDIMDRATTIGLMRTQNIAERSSRDD